MSKMIQIRNVPEPVHRTLKSEIDIRTVERAEA